jgi:ABC-type lipoprotein release transport system permease subunit
VAVVGRNLAQLEGIELGDDLRVTSAAGDAALRVVGISGSQQEDGTVVFVPLPTARALLDRPGGASGYWVRTESQDPTDVDHTTALLEDRLVAAGYEVSSEVRYVAERGEVADNRTLATTIAVLGFLVVAISMVGLASAMTTSVLERTREIGVLRSIGARARDVRRVFTTEGVALAVLGWLIGIPLGYAFTRGLVRLVWELVDVRLPVVFPVENLLLALVGMLVLALVSLSLPVHRAVRLRPGEALRYE